MIARHFCSGLAWPVLLSQFDSIHMTLRVLRRAGRRSPQLLVHSEETFEEETQHQALPIPARTINMTFIRGSPDHGPWHIWRELELLHKLGASNVHQASLPGPEGVTRNLN